MKFKKDSLIFKITYYNNISIFINSVLLFIIVILVIPKNIAEENSLIFYYFLLITIFTIVVSKIVLNNRFKRMLLPLEQISNLANSVAKREKIKNVKVLGEGEIQKLSTSFKEMVEKIDVIQENLEIKNEELANNIKRIKDIDKLFMSINLETEIQKAINKLLHGFTQSSGLGYSRAMYFRYSRENDYFIGENISINDKLNSENSEKNNTKKLKFQLESLEKLILFTKISNDRNNLVTQSFKSKKIIHRNDVGFRHNIGNDIFKAVGLNNFFIFPIHGAGKYSGVIIVDQYSKNSKVTIEELELLNLFSMNFSIGIKNRNLTTSLLEKQRFLTIEKMAKRFLALRGEVVKILLDCIDEEKDEIEIKKELNNIKGLLFRIKEDNDSLKDYSEKIEVGFSEIYLEEIINEVINENKNDLDLKNIEISFFSGSIGSILGNRKKIKKSIIEIFKNAYNALENIEKNKKINISLLKNNLTKKIELKIIDNGIGITDEQINRIYEPFISFTPQALGLGLFFVKQTIKEHNGVVKHYSKLNNGTEVRITLNTYKEEK